MDDKPFSEMIHGMFDHIWDCQIDHPIFQDTVGDLMMAVIQCHKTLTEEKPEQRWIPVSERLPEEFDTILITHRGGVSCGWYNGIYFEKGAGAKHRPIKTVVAWMPLPEPYKEEQDDDK